MCPYVPVESLKLFYLLTEKKKVELGAGVLQDSLLS